MKTDKLMNGVCLYLLQGLQLSVIFWDILEKYLPMCKSRNNFDSPNFTEYYYIFLLLFFFFQIYCPFDISRKDVFCLAFYLE